MAPAYRWLGILWVVAFLLGMIGDSVVYPFYLIVAVLHISIADELDATETEPGSQTNPGESYG